MTNRSGSAPSAWVLRELSGLSPGAHVLDVACGSGRHTRAALDLGLRVMAIDRAAEGIADLADRPDFRFIALDLEDGSPFPLRDDRFDAIVVTNYLYRPLLPVLAGMVARDGGTFIYETFAVGQERFGRPSNPDFLLRPNELIDVALAAGLEVSAYEAGAVFSDKIQVMQRIIAQSRLHT